MFLLTIAGLTTGYLFPVANSPALRLTAVSLFAYATLVTSMGASFRQFLSVLRKPLIPLWILFLTHLFTPLIAWVVGMIVYPDDPLTRLGYLIAASVPIGVSSIVWTALTGGYMAVSLAAVTFDTTIVPLLLPAFFKVVVGKTIPIHYGGMALQLMLMVTLPSVIGMIWHDRASSRVMAFYEGIGGFSSKLVIIAVIYINSAVAVSGITWSPALLKTALVTLFLVVAGFLAGYGGSRPLTDRSSAMVLTLMYNVGLRNISVGLVLALTYFPPPVAIPITLYILFQQPVAAVIPMLFKGKISA